MLRYFKYSLALHAILFLLLAIWTFFLPERKHRNVRFVILPKGTSLDAVMTKEVVDAIEQPNSPPSPTPPLSLAPTASPAPGAYGNPEQPNVATSPSPTPMPTSTPPLTVSATPPPQKTITITPRATPPATPKPKKSPSNATPALAKTSPTPTKRSERAHQKESEKLRQPRSTPIRTSKSTPKPITSAYDLASAAPGSNRFAGVDLPRSTPSGVEVREAAPAQEIGVPGVPEGVEGAPLPLDRTQSLLSMLYTTRARMKIQSNFTVPPGVNDPNLVCVVEWEILRDGTIRNIRVVKSTGVAQYDACAVNALRKTANLGPLPPEFGKESIWTSLTFVFAGDERGNGTLRAPSSPQ